MVGGVAALQGGGLKLQLAKINVLGNTSSSLFLSTGFARAFVFFGCCNIIIEKNTVAVAAAVAFVVVVVFACSTLFGAGLSLRSRVCQLH